MIEELQLDQMGRLLHQSLEIAQAPSTVPGGDLGSALQLGDRMFPRQMQQPQHDAQPLRAALREHRFGPGAGLRPQQPAAVQQMGFATLDEMTFPTVQMGQVGGELFRLGLGMEGNLFPAGVIDPDQPGFPTHPDRAADIFGRH